MPYGTLNPYIEPLPPLMDDLYALPEDPRRQANRFGLGQAGLALLANAGSNRYGESLAQAMQAYFGGRQSQMQQFQETARQRQLMEARAAEVARLARSEERQSEVAEAKLRAIKEKEAAAAEERRFYLEQLPEEERGKYAFAPVAALKEAVKPKQRRTMKMDLGNREVLIDAETGEEIESYSQATGGQGGRKTYRLDLGSRISVRDAQTHEEVQSIPKDPKSGATGEELSPGGLTAKNWLDIVREENPSMSAIEAAAEAERRAAASRRKVVEGPGIPVDREAAGALGNAKVRPVQTQRPVPGGAGGAPQAGRQRVSADEVRASLPDAIRDTPGITEMIEADLASGKSIQEIVAEILAAARRRGAIR